MVLMKSKSVHSNWYIVVALTLFVFCLSVMMADARTVVRSGETVSVAGEQVVEGDFYSAAGKINLSGSVEEDMVAAAGQISINGSVADNAFLIGGQVDVHGTIGDDLRIISGETVIADPVMGDVLVIGGQVHILSTASVAGDVLLYASEAVIEGSVGGDVLGTVGNLRIDAPISGNIDVRVEKLVLGDKASIEGFVRYVSYQLVTQSPNAIVAGDLLRNDPVLPDDDDNSMLSSLIPALVILFSVLVWYLISRRSLSAVVNRALIRSFRPLFLGFATVILTPIIISVLILSMIGTLVGVTALFGYLFLGALSIIALVAVLGQLMMFAFNRPSEHVSLFSLSVGVVGVMLLTLLPVLGQAILLLLMVLSIGAMIDLLIRPNLDK